MIVEPADDVIVKMLEDKVEVHPTTTIWPCDVVPMLIARIRAEQAEKAELVEALKPFVWYEEWMDEWEADAAPTTFKRHTFGDLRRALTLLPKEEEQ